MLLLLACASEPSPDTPPAARERTLTLAAYTTPREAYGKAILPAFAASWKERTGETVTFEESYQGSGAQARAVREGFEADVVALSLDPDVAVLEAAGMVAPTWRDQPHGGIVTTSLAVIAVRPGNPKKIADWADLARPDVEVLTPNVRTSGGAMWNVLAIWGSAGQDGLGLLTGVLARVTVMDKGARESIVTFEKGVGDAAITYENEVRVATAAGQAMEYVIPPRTIVIENPVAVVDTWADKHGNRDLAEAFVAFCHSPEAQAAYARYGLRPVDAAAMPTDLPAPGETFTIRDLGGWDNAQAEVFAKGGVYDRALGAKQP